MPRYLVTGATGFVGSRLAALLVERGHAVRIYRRSSSRLDALDGLPFEDATGDLHDEDGLARAAAGCDGLFHVAGDISYHSADRDRLRRTNAEAPRVACAAARRAGVRRLVLTSSLAAIGYAPGGRSADETTPFNWPPGFHYMETKRDGELAVLAAAATAPDLEAVSVNPTVVMGPGQVRPVFRALLEPLARGLFPFWLPGGINVVDVDDVAAGHLLAMERGRSGERYLLAGENVTNHVLQDEMARALGVRPPLLPLPKELVSVAASALRIAEGFGARLGPGAGILSAMGLTTYATAAKAERELGWKARPLRDTVHRTVADYRARGWIPS